MNISDRDNTDLFAGAAEPTDRDLVALHARLTAEADAAGLLDVAYRTLDTPVGLLLLASTPNGLVRVAYETEDHDAVLDGLAAHLSPRILHAPDRLDAAATPAR